MTHQHLNDADIQQYVLEKQLCAANITEHIAECEHCATKVANYALLFVAIRQEEVPVFDIDMAGVVMQQIAPLQPTTASGNGLVYFITLALIGLVGVTCYLFRNVFSKTFPGLAPMLTYLIVTTVISILIFQCVDMYRKYKQQMKSLNFY